MNRFIEQLYWLLYRNYLIKIRFKQLTFQEIFISLIFVANIATIRYTTQTDSIPAIPSASLKSHQLVDSRFMSSLQTFPIAFTPDTPDIESIAADLATVLNVTASPAYIGYPTEEAIVEDVVNATTNISVALIFDEDFPSNLSYKIRLTYGAVPLNYDAYLGSGSPYCYDSTPEYGLAFSWKCPANSYLYSGFSVIQATVEHLIVKMVTGDTSLEMPDVSIRMFPKGQYDYSLEPLRITVSVYIVLAYMPFTLVLLTTLVYEKERKIKEVMKIMGLNNVAFWLSWIIVYIGIVFIVAMIIAGFCKIITLLPAANFFILFLGLFFYGLSVVTLSFMLTPLFQKAATAGAAGSFCIILFVVPYIPLAVSGIESMPAGAIWAICLFSPSAIALFMDRCLLFEQITNGVQFNNLGEGYFPPYAPLIMIFVDIILYLLLAIYFENVVPGAYGQSMSPLFFLKPSYWRGASDTGPNAHTGLLQDTAQLNRPVHDDALIEPVPAALRDRNAIRISNVKKIFPGKGDKPDVKAVNGISLDIYEGQITCLLGHNGAGKTTLMNCLTGMVRATDGQATAYGLDIFDASGMERIRSMTGICLQENALIDLLTPEEHLKFYAGLTGVPKAQVAEKVEEVLELIDLKTQRATFASKLSGGQKRKLCVGMAIIGNPKILFLDEPSSGMDPYSRRKMWSLLKKQRKGRITLLTTHFMDEADILADRKAIISKGQLKCLGSSLFLKNKFGVGYRLGLVKESNCDDEKVTGLIQKHIPEASLTRSHGMELAYSLPLKDVSLFAGMFKSLEEGSASSLGIQSYGVSMTTLEEVFLKIGEEAEIDEADAAAESGQINLTLPANRNADSTQPENRVSGMSLEDDGNGTGAAVTVNMEQSPLDSTIMATQPIQVKHNEQLKSLIRIETLRAIRNPATYICRIVLPIGLMIVGGVLALIIDFGGDGPSDVPSPLVFSPSMYFPALNLSPDDMSTDLLYKDSLPTGQNIADLVTEFDNRNIKSNATADLNALYEVRPHNGAFDVMDLGTTGSASQFTAYYNDTAQHSLPVALSIMSSALLGLYGNASTITASSHPFPKPASPPTNTITSGILFVYIFGLGVTWILMGFPIEKVKERELKIKAQLRISGIDTFSYWGAVFAIDLVQMILVVIVGLIIIFAIQVPSLTTGGAIFCLIVTIILYVPVSILHVYCLSFIFDKFETAQGYAFVLICEIPLFLFLPTMFIDIYVSTAAAAGYHLVMCVLHPSYAIFGALYFIEKVYTFYVAFNLGNADGLTFGDYFAPDALIWPTMLLLLLDLVLLIFFLRFCEVKKSGGHAKDTCPCLVDSKIQDIARNDDVVEDEDSDVKEERMKVEELYESDQSSAVTISELRKEFVKRSSKGEGKKKESTKVAVRNLSLTVQTGEVFGLLGPNGAGKTTTMNVVTADTDATNGQVRVGGYDVASALSDAYASMGYCPQVDPLWEDVTMREHLEGYAGFKGIHQDDRKQIADNFMSAIGVMEHADKKAKELSGGTKRKLCFALSMLGDPKIVLLDEPSTGMDPSSKRFLWNVITSSFLEKKGAILTTHSMEEADAVCSRVGIMIQGQLRCLGTTQHLKDKYGGGYTLDIKLNPGMEYYTQDQTNQAIMDVLDEKMEILHKQVLFLIPQAEVTESFAERISYKVPRDSDITLSTVFTFLEQGKQDYGIEEYSFSQTTLEQVFIEFAKTQVDDPEGEGEVISVNQSNTDNRPGSRHSVRHAPKPQISVSMDV